jgi:hypothetical protein
LKDQYASWPVIDLLPIFPSIDVNLAFWDIDATRSGLPKQLTSRAMAALKSVMLDKRRLDKMRLSEASRPREITSN